MCACVWVLCVCVCVRACLCVDVHVCDVCISDILYFIRYTVFMCVLYCEDKNHLIDYLFTHNLVYMHT